ncbi:SIR2 family protein [Thalassospira xiamenensis]|uniref:SIR2 family protein n=1 Tax=Thalassospira xiamenensis TaxID=220697 RepID=UPI002000456F|nr:SIR2 family protein [Thalassospira xiamenensis]MCK2165125.1 SIR2 family protein [Thalassospira xiamenensis]
MNDFKKDSASSNFDEFRKLPDFPAFQAFAKALWRNEAAVMVGAGFSRVCRREADSPLPPLWSDFEKVMEADLGYEPGRGPDALRLAQEYATLHGEDGLTRLIRRLVADEQWEPGALHKVLLEFPWRDILTTNWDTLLERTKPETPDRIYSCVRTVQEIAHQRQPRIVKLHGSLPSYKPFIFTEDDFRTYPSGFAPFVNLAQQAMLESELCLIGFSGVDPNFLAWSGWVRDTLDVSARRIRLVGVLNLSPVTRSLLETRNVTPIDLAPLVSLLHPSQQHEKAIEFFFEALLALRPPSPFAWEKTSNGFWGIPHDAPEEEKVTREEVAKAWASDRKNYPGWIYCPDVEIRDLRRNWVTLRDTEESDELVLSFASERIWRHRIGGIWLDLGDLKDADAHYDSSNHFLTAEEQIQLCSAAATEWRRYQEWDKWRRWMSRLRAIRHDDAVLHHTYEKGLRALLNWDDEAVLAAVKALRSDKPIWIMRRAGLLSALFLYPEAAEAYQKALRLIREKLLAAPTSAWLISLEGWASMFHRVSYRMLNEDSFARLKDESDETRMRYFGAKADPWDVISRLEQLAAERIERNRQDAERWKLSFKSGTYSPDTTVRLGGDESCPFYSLADLVERTGAPVNFQRANLFGTRLATAYSAIKNPDENDLLAFLACYRGSDEKILDAIMPRMRVAMLGGGVVSHLLEVIPRRIDNLVSTKTKREDASGYLRFLLCLIQRVVVRSSSKQAFDIYNWALNLFNSNQLPWNCYEACGAVLESSVEPMLATDRQLALDRALNLNIPGEIAIDRPGNKMPKLFNSFTKEDFKNFIVTSSVKNRIDALIDAVKSGEKADRTDALKRLYYIFSNGKLPTSQRAMLEKAIWSKCDSKGWPAQVDLLRSVFLVLPGKKKAVPLFLKDVFETVAGGKFDDEMLITLRNGFNHMPKTVSVETVAGCAHACLKWKPNENGVRDPFGLEEGRSLSIEAEIGLVLAECLLPRLDLADLSADTIEQLKKTKELKVISSSAAIAFHIYRFWPDRVRDSMELIRSAMASREPRRVYPAYSAIRQFVENAEPKAGVPREITEILLHVSEQRTQPGLSSALEVLTSMVKQKQLNDDDLQRLVDALPDVLEEYRYDQKFLEVPARAELPIVRQRVHRLADMLCRDFPELKDIKESLASDPLPEVRVIPKN